MSKDLKQIIGKSFLDIAEAIETGDFGETIAIGVTTLGSEHGPDNIIDGAKLAQQELSGVEIVLIGHQVEGFQSYAMDCESDVHEKMEELLANGTIDACVTMHYNFPVGVSTVGRLVTPARGKEVFISTTTGTAATDRSEAMFKNALYGLITAKACGIEDPTLGVLNLESARKVERSLKQLNDNGYPINFAESKRADGGNIMRGNDLLLGAADVMVMDTLTGNIMMKLFSSYTTGGKYEGIGYGYGPGIGFDFDKTILILSRASGTPVVKNAIKYAYQLVQNDLKRIIKKEYEKLKANGYDEIIAAFNQKAKVVETEATPPPKEIVTESIAGIDVLDLDAACHELWKNDIYAETGMGCTGPIINVNEKNIEKAKKILRTSGYIA
jgi:hypothetical protein